jgi:aconitate hydratase
MGIAPFVFTEGKSRRDYALTGRESITIPPFAATLKPRMQITATITYPDGKTAELPLWLRIDTADEVAYFKNGGILRYVLRNLAKAA